ncbi:MAG: vWA domain-containing protein [Pseudomonadota bacterium]
MKTIFNYHFTPIFTSPFTFMLAVIIAFYTNGSSYVLAVQQTSTKPTTQHIRVLIDVSGSMKKTDPQNLRSPSLRLLVGLLPSASSAAVWSFGTKVYELVKSAQVDEKWKQQANIASKKIHSNDLFTNIGQALSTASQDWLKSSITSESESRNIILLTDGMVDISPDNQKNVNEKQRILAELLPLITDKQIQIHTIALSNKADFDFLKKLSLGSDGSFEQAENADALERLFLHLFEKTTQPDTLPLIENEFIVDESVYEMTLLVFKDKSSGNQITEIIEPSGNSFTKNNAPKYVKWHSEKNYDLLTIQKPFVGDWKINASIDPDNRVMIVTNLKIQTNHLPNNIFVGEEIDLHLFLTDQKEIITDDEFLQLTSISVKKQDADNIAAKKWFLHDNGLGDDKQAHDGLFNISLGKKLKAGKNKFIIRASSETFARELQQTFTVHDVPLLHAELEIIEKDGVDIRRIRVSPNLEYINPNKIKISAELYSKDNEPQMVTLQNDNLQQIEWFFETDNLDPDENYQMVFHMKSHSRRGRPINYTSKKIQLNLNKIVIDSGYTENKGDQEIKVTVSQAKEKKINKIPQPKQDNNKQLQDQEINNPDEANKDAIDWTMGIIIAAVLNIIIALLVWFFYRRWKKGQDVDLIDLTGDMG